MDDELDTLETEVKLLAEDGDDTLDVKSSELDALDMLVADESLDVNNSVLTDDALEADDSLEVNNSVLRDDSLSSTLATTFLVLGNFDL